jgi:hypothetical protein
MIIAGECREYAQVFVLMFTVGVSLLLRTRAGLGAALINSNESWLATTSAAPGASRRARKRSEVLSLSRHEARGPRERVTLGVSGRWERKERGTPRVSEPGGAQERSASNQSNQILIFT